MKKLFAVLLGGILFFGMNFSCVEAKNISAEVLSSSRKYTPPPARYAPPQVPDYGLPTKSTYTPPPPPEPKK